MLAEAHADAHADFFGVLTGCGPGGDVIAGGWHCSAEGCPQTADTSDEIEAHLADMRRRGIATV